MKSKLFAVIVLVLAAQVSMAQFSFGVKAGANLNKIQGQSFSEKFEAGYLAGVFAMLGVSDKFAIQPEVLFVQSQTKVDSNFRQTYQNAVSDITHNKVKLNYLSIPILLDYKLMGSFLAVQAGPQFGILIDQDKKLVQNGKDAFKKGDFSGVAGLQLKVSKFMASARYVVGFNDIKDVQDVTNSKKWKNQAIQLSVGISL